MAKKSDSWIATIHVSNENCTSLIASLSCEEVDCKQIDQQKIAVVIHGKSASDLRAKYNSTMRSLRAATEILGTIGD